MQAPSSFALVTPRAVSPFSGESLPLADLIRDYLYDNDVRTIRLVGQGKSTALSHLAAEFSDTVGIRFIDGELPTDLDEWLLTVFACSDEFKPDIELQIANWSQDDVIEYLMAKDRSKCKSVMQRLTKSEDIWLGNRSPLALSIVLDEMIQSDRIQSAEEAVMQHFDSLDLSESQRSKLGYLTFQHLFDNEALGRTLSKLVPQVIDRRTTKFLCNQPIRYALAKREIISSLESGLIPKVMNQAWPRSFVRLVAAGIAQNVEVNNFLNRLANKAEFRGAPNAISLLIRNDPNWRPTLKRRLNLDKAQISGVNWKNVCAEKSSMLGIDFSNASLQKASFTKSLLTSGDFSCADLTGARLKKVQASRCNFSDATMRGVLAQSAGLRKANFENAIAEFADFTSAVFKGANLRRVNFSNSKLSLADFLGCDVTDVDFSNAKLDNATLERLDLRTVRFDGANLTKAAMSKCDMEGIRIDDAILNKAWLNDAILTSSRRRNVSLAGCRFHNSKLAEVDWEGCDLRGAQFVNTHFQMGSTRCGKVDSPYPSHGTRTGFYTDEYDEQYFKRPEEIRKANLCDCDLRGARVLKTDFYLVDLRGAKYDEKQREHFQRCGAILSD